MHSTSLRQDGDLVVLDVPPALLEILQLSAGSKVRLAVEGGRLVVSPVSKPRYTLDALLAASDQTAPLPPGDREWLDAPAVGREWL